MMPLVPARTPSGPVGACVALRAGCALLASLFLLAGCSGGGDMTDSMALTMEERVVEPPAPEGPIKFVWEGGGGTRPTVITTTTSTTTAPTKQFIARQKIAEHRRKPRHAHRIIPPLNISAPPTPPAREPLITLVPLDGGLVIRKRAAAQSGDVATGQETAVPTQRLINSAPTGQILISNPSAGRVTVLGVTQETITPGSTRGP